MSGAPPLDPILEKLKRAAWTREWPPQFASNLGVMATLLDPAEPKKAAKRMFLEAFGQEAGEANWRKRKRYIRFAGEETHYDRDGEYVATKEPYLSLASAFARLKYPKVSDGSRRANRLLVQGTSLGPEIDVLTIDGFTQAVECVKRLKERCNDDDEIRKAFSYLNDFPLAPFSPDELKQLKLGHAALTASFRRNGLSIVDSRKSTIAAYKSEVSSEIAYPWYVGRLLLGYIYYPQFIACAEIDMSAVEFAEELWSLCTDRESDPHGTRENELALEFVDKCIVEWLDKNEIEDFCFDDSDHGDGGRIPERLRRKIYIRKPVYLIVDYDDNAVSVRIDISGEVDSGSLKHDDVVVYKRGETDDKDMIVMVYDGQLHGVNVGFSGLDGMIEWAFQLVSSDNKISVISGALWHDYSKRVYNISVDDEEFKQALGEGAFGSSIFVPTLWDDAAQLSSAPQGSIAGTILRNLAYAPEEMRIDTLLLGDVRSRLKGIVSFIRGELEKTATALRDRGFEP